MVANADLSSGCRLTAAGVLVRKTGTRHFDAVLAAAPTAPLEDQEWYARLLLGERAAPEWEPRVLRYAVSVMEARRAAHPEGGGYFIARALEGRAGRVFLPPLVNGELPADFFSRSVANALEWWRAYERDLPP